MANDHHQPQDRRHGSIVTNNSPRDQSHGHNHGHGHHSSSSKHARKHRAPNPPVPHPTSDIMQVQRPASSQRVPASHAAQPQVMSDAAMPASSEPAPIPTVDPESMPAKQGLNEWGAFTGGTPTSSLGAGGTFGFGPLLFHAGGEQVGDDIETLLDSNRQEKMTRETDVFEMDRLLQNDPISFNPLQAISWARLDDAPTDERGLDFATAQSHRSGQASPPTDRCSTASGNSQHANSEQVGQHVSKQLNPASKNTQQRNKKQVSYAVASGSDYVEPSPSPVGTMSKTFSAVSLQAPDTTDGRSTFVPPPTTRVSTSHPSPTAGPIQQLHGSGQHGQRQQRKHRHRNGTKNCPHTRPSLIQNELYQQQQVFRPPPALPPSALPLSMSSQPAFPIAQQASPYSTYQVGPAPYTNPAAHPPPPSQQQDLFLCLGPYCSARFQTEAELSAHYRAEHSLACSWASCGAAGFTSNNALVWHVKAEHLLLCPVPGCCDRVFASKKALDGHVRVS